MPVYDAYLGGLAGSTFCALFWLVCCCCACDDAVNDSFVATVVVSNVSGTSDGLGDIFVTVGKWNFNMKIVT